MPLGAPGNPGEHSTDNSRDGATRCNSKLETLAPAGLTLPGGKLGWGVPLPVWDERSALAFPMEISVEFADPPKASKV